jgi:signal transduction histidine kinase/ligand-binding sensor domain-containing protein
MANCFARSPLPADVGRRSHCRVVVALKKSRVWQVLLAGICAFAMKASATTNNSTWSARVWQTDNGLPDNSVTGVAQTPDGYLWVSTESGLARFDGARFQDFALTAPSGRTRPLIRVMSLGQGNQIWLAVEGGLAVMLSPQATNLFTAKDGITYGTPQAIARDRRDDMWIGYADGSVCWITKGHVTRFADSKAPAGRGPCTLASDINGQVWFAKAGHIGVVRDENFQSLLTLNEATIKLGRARVGGMWICAGLQLWHCNENGTAISCGTLPTDRSGVEPTVVFEDRTGAVWVGTSVNGLFHYDGTNFEQVETSHEEILCLGEDDQGDLWAGTGGGLNRVRHRVVELQAGESGLPVTRVRSICQDKTGVMWAVAQNGELARYTGSKWRSVTSRDGWPGARATCAVSDGADGVWVGTQDTGVVHWTSGQCRILGPGNGLAGKSVRGLFLDHAGDLWIALDSPAAFQRLHEDRLQTYVEPHPGSYIRAMAEDTAGTLWCGTQNGVLFRVEGDTLKDETALQSFLHPIAIRCMTALPDGSVWIGYAGAGVGLLRNGKFAHISEEQGLHDAYICSMEADDRGRLWCAADRGIFEVSLGELEGVAEGRVARVNSFLFGRDEGLASLQGSFEYAPGAAKSGDGRLWFPMRTGLAMVNPNGFPANRMPPPVLIERVAVDELPVAMDAEGRFVLPPAHRRLDVDFTALNFVTPENVRFRYRLEGWDSGWIDGGAQRSANYSRLPAGTYKFCVTACNDAGLWNKNGAVIALIVQPFLWERWSVRAASLGVFTFGVIAAVRYVSFRRLRLKLARLEQETSLHRERARIAQDLHDDIGASLTHIALLSELAQKDFAKPIQAKAHIDQIFRSARTVVQSLDEIVWTVNPKNNTLDLFIAYLCTYAPEYLQSAGIRCRLDVPEDVPSMPLPSEVVHHLYLAVKETLHNVVKHAGATEVWLRLRLEAQMIILTIEDNGCGFRIGDKAAPDADGLGNLNRRLGEISGRCEQRSEPGKGMTTTFTLPLKNPPV